MMPRDAPELAPRRAMSSRPLRLVFVNKYARVTGGADRYCLELARLLRARGHDVRFLATHHDSNLETNGRFIGTRVTHETRDGLSSRQRLHVVADSLWNAEAADAMERLLTEFRPDVVHVHKLLPNLSIAPLWVARRHRVPVLQTLHDYELVSASAFDVRGWLDRRETRFSYRALNSITYPVRRVVYRRLIDCAIAGSAFTQGVYRARGIDSSVLPLFVTVDHPTQRPFSEREGVVFASRLAPEKGVRDVLQLARFVSRVPVTIVGAGALSAAVAAEAARLPNLTALGWRSQADVQDVLARSRVLVMPSRWDEPAGISALEAMALGTPVVAYARGGLQEYVTGGGGTAVRESTRELIRATLTLHDEEGAWTRASRSGLEAARTRHAPGTYVAAIEALYGRLASR
jgi:glycosyltransferase involved in cell wall biosynthesis